MFVLSESHYVYKHAKIDPSSALSECYTIRNIYCATFVEVHVLERHDGGTTAQRYTIKAWYEHLVCVKLYSISSSPLQDITKMLMYI